MPPSKFVLKDFKTITLPRGSFFPKPLVSFIKPLVTCKAFTNLWVLLRTRLESRVDYTFTRWFNSKWHKLSSLMFEVTKNDNFWVKGSQFNWLTGPQEGHQQNCQVKSFWCSKNTNQQRKMVSKQPKLGIISLNPSTQCPFPFLKVTPLASA